LVLVRSASITRVDSRATFFRSAGISRSINLSHLKLSFVAFDKRFAGATSDINGDGEPSKRSRKFANPSDRIYIAFFCHLLCQRCARRYIAIPDENFPFYFISNKRIRCIYYANMNKKYFIIKFCCPALSRCRADITFINRFLNSRLFR
jgi:hypothetical protein